MKYLFIALLCLSPYFCNANTQTYLSVDELYRSPYLSQVKFSFDGSYLTGITYADERQNLVIISPGTGDETLLFRPKASRHILNYEWIADNLILVHSYVKKDNKRWDGFIEIIEKEGELYGVYRTIAVEGHVVDVMPKFGNKILFAHNVGESSSKFELYIADYDALRSDTLEGATKVASALLGGVSFTYDQRIDQLIGVRVDRENEEVEVFTREWGLHDGNTYLLLAILRIDLNPWVLLLAARWQ